MSVVLPEYFLRSPYKEPWPQKPLIKQSDRRSTARVESKEREQEARGSRLKDVTTCKALAQVCAPLRSAGRTKVTSKVLFHLKLSASTSEEEQKKVLLFICQNRQVRNKATDNVGQEFLSVSVILAHLGGGNKIP